MKEKRSDSLPNVNSDKDDLFMENQDSGHDNHNAIYLKENFRGKNFVKKGKNAVYELNSQSNKDLHSINKKNKSGISKNSKHLAKGSLNDKTNLNTKKMNNNICTRKNEVLTNFHDLANRVEKHLSKMINVNGINPNHNSTNLTKDSFRPTRNTFKENKEQTSPQNYHHIEKGFKNNLKKSKHSMLIF